MRLLEPEFLAGMTIWAEARSESYEGKLAVAEVIRNRMVKHFFSDGSVESTVLRPWQFSCWNTDDPNRILMFRLDNDNRVWKQCLEVWRLACSDNTNVAKGAMHYLNPAAVKKMPAWAAPPAEVVAMIGRHHFYKMNL